MAVARQYIFEATSPNNRQTLTGTQDARKAQGGVSVRYLAREPLGTA